MRALDAETSMLKTVASGIRKIASRFPWRSDTEIIIRVVLPRGRRIPARVRFAWASAWRTIRSTSSGASSALPQGPTR